MSDKAVPEQVRPLKMRNLRAGRTGNRARQDEPDQPPVASGPVDDEDHFERSLNHAIEQKEMTGDAIAVFTLLVRHVDLRKLNRLYPTVISADLDDFVTERVSSVDPGLVFLTRSPTEIVGFLATQNRVEAERVMGRILASLSGVPSEEVAWVALAPQLGAAFIEEELEDCERALDAAAATLAQTSSAAPFLMYNDYVRGRLNRESTAADTLPEAVAANDVELEYEPRITTNGDHVVGVEAFARWHHPSLGRVPPQEFLRIADRLDLSVELGRRLRDRGAGASVVWFREGWLTDGRLWLNVSLTELCHPDFPDSLHELRERYPDVAFGIEIDDSPLLDEAVVSSRFEPVRKLDVEIGLDNVGATTLSVTRLQRLPVSSVNLNGSIVHSLVSDAAYQHLAASICEIAHNRGIVVTACQTETREQLSAARKLGIDNVQGHVHTEPVRAPEVLDLLTSGFGSRRGRSRR